MHVDGGTGKFKRWVVISGRCDGTLNLWGIQTSEVAKTYSNTCSIYSIFISLGSITIALVSGDRPVLWDTRIGECHYFHMSDANSVRFSPANSWLSISVSHDDTM